MIGRTFLAYRTIDTVDLAHNLTCKWGGGGGTGFTFDLPLRMANKMKVPWISSQDNEIMVDHSIVNLD